MLELEDHVDFVARRIGVERRIFEENSGRFPDSEDRSAAFENLAVHFLEKFMQTRSLHVEGASVGKILTDPATAAAIAAGKGGEGYSLEEFPTADLRGFGPVSPYLLATRAA